MHFNKRSKFFSN